MEVVYVLLDMGDCNFATSLDYNGIWSIGKAAHVEQIVHFFFSILSELTYCRLPSLRHKGTGGSILINGGPKSVEMGWCHHEVHFYFFKALAGLTT